MGWKLWGKKQTGENATPQSKMKDFGPGSGTPHWKHSSWFKSSTKATGKGKTTGKGKGKRGGKK